MIEKSIDYNGSIVYWSLSDGTNIHLLRQGLQDIGRAHLIPETRVDLQALQRSIREAFPGKRTLVRPLSGKPGYAVVHEHSGGTEMEYEEEVRFAVVANEIFCSESNHPKLAFIEDEYQNQKDLVTANKLGGVLVKACQELQGIPLRNRGGLYWIPEANRLKWEEIVRVVERCNIRNTTSLVKTTTDKKTLDAVCDSLVHQVSKKLENLETSLEEGELGKRGLKTREREAQELDDLVQTYEKILGKTLTSLRDRASDVESAASMALLEAMAN
tara:strand:- start:1839 stop:2654 length:816 start_codon:yes stop_codon:yes gene_type:complete